jgi:hypothetical protein
MHLPQHPHKTWEQRVLTRNREVRPIDGRRKEILDLAIILSGRTRLGQYRERVIL